MDFNCNGELTLSDFLAELRTLPLPNIRYVSVIGHSHQPLGRFFGLPSHRISDCLSEHWDGAVAIDSANLREALLEGATTPENVEVINNRNRFHTTQTSDISAILCAFDRNCTIFKANSPVDIEIRPARIFRNDNRVGEAVQYVGYASRFVRLHHASPIGLIADQTGANQ